jgi:1-acyl-sn-glycerol-3-phosphate acyltransferase
MTYWVVKLVIAPFLRYFYRINVDGLANVPASGPVIMASNHV